jgi:hypothetical protein
METRDLLPLIGVLVGTVLGWVLNQLTQWVLLRRDEKKAIARTISDLLEVRHRLLTFPRITELLSRDFGLPQESHTVVKVVLAQLFPPDPDLSKRYSEAVNLVAAANPILGFRLRSQDRVLPFLDHLRKIALNDPSASTAFPGMERELMGHLAPNLDRLLKELAWSHGILTSFAVRRQLTRPLEIPDGFLESFKAMLPKPQQQSNQPSDPP